MSYVDQNRHDLEFEVGDYVFVKMASYRHVMRFGRKGKLELRHIRLYEITKRINRVAYQLVPASMGRIHNVFQVSLLHKCLGDPSQIVGLENMELEDSLVYEKCSIWIVD